MGDPPDRHKNNTPSLQWDKTKKIPFASSTDPIYLTMTRTNSLQNLSNLSPFLLKKAIDATCGEVLECKKIRSGDILIKTKNLTQANKLITLTALTNNITIDIKVHNYLNTSKGIIYSNELRGIAEEEILQELKTQNVIEVKKILKKKDEELTETGLIILTFQGSNLPGKINIGYSKVEIRTYIPSPMRCNNCLRYNHTAKFCKNESICYNCGTHHDIEDNEECYKPKNCSNCTFSNIKPTNHSAKDRKCPIFIKHHELQAIKTTYKVDNKAANQIYEERHQHNHTTYATIIKSHNNTTTPNATKTTSTSSSAPNLTPLPLPSTSTKSITSNTRSAITYEDIIDPQHITKELNTQKHSTIKILPRNTPKSVLNKIKKTNTKHTASTNATINMQYNSRSSDGDEMDYDNIEL